MGECHRQLDELSATSESRHHTSFSLVPSVVPAKLSGQDRTTGRHPVQGQRERETEGWLVSDVVET